MRLAVLMLAAIALAAARAPQDADLSALAADARWEELIAAASERLADAPGDVEALYWSGRAHVERAQQLLAGAGGRGTRRGVDFAGDLARALLDRARGQLEVALAGGGGPKGDADEWLAYARYLRGDDAELGGDMERWFEQEGASYAAYVRGLIARDARDPAAADWFARASTGPSPRPDVALVWAETLAGQGDREGALAAWGVARSAGAPDAELAASLLAMLPDRADAAVRLSLLDELIDDEAARRDALLAWYRAWALEQLGRADEAEAAMASAPDGRTDGTDRAHARLLAVLDRHEEAMAVLQAGIDRGDTEALEQLVTLGDDLGGRRRFELALDAYDAALAGEPNHARAQVNRALTLARSGTSLDGYAQLVARHPGRADLLNDAALAEWGWGRIDVARRHLEAAAAMPAAADPRENLALLLLTVAPIEPERAAGLVDEVLEREPARARALFLRHLAAAIRSR